MPRHPQVAFGWPELELHRCAMAATLNPSGGAVLADQRYNAKWIRSALIEFGISPNFPSRLSGKRQLSTYVTFYRLLHKVEDMFANLEG